MKRAVLVVKLLAGAVPPLQSLPVDHVVPVLPHVIAICASAEEPKSKTITGIATKEKRVLASMATLGTQRLEESTKGNPSRLVFSCI